MIYFFSLIFVLLIRLFILKKASLTAVDQWYWLKYRDAVRSQKQCPPELPEYILETKQWYPPIFGWFLSKLSDKFLKYSNLITQILSAFRIAIVSFLFFFLNDQFSFELFLVSLVYLTAPILVYYDNQINSRIFGAIILDILIVLFFGYFEYSNYYVLMPIFALNILLLFTHKMSHQLYLFLIIGFSIYYENVVPIAMYVLATIFSLIFFDYHKYLKAHIEIVKFWHRNRYKLGAHQFYESSIYGKDGYVYKNRMHGNDIKLWIKKLALIIGMFPFMIFIIFNFQFNFFGLVIFLTLLFIALTSFVPFMYCLGMGSLYTYNLVTFSCYYLIYSDIDYSTPVTIALLILVFILTMISIYKFYRGLVNKSKFKDSRLDEAIEFLKTSNFDRVLVIPFQLPDEIAYKTGKKVFWGAHGYGFLWLEPYFPVFNRKIEEALSDWNLGGIFLQKSYWNEFYENVDVSLLKKEFENDKYIIFSIKEWKNIDRIPNWALERYPDIFGKSNV